MKRYGNLFTRICDIENIKLAHKNARKNKTRYKEVIEVDSDIDKYCSQLKELLESGKFKNSEYEIFTKLDKGKLREIYKLPYYPDRIVHHAIVQVLEPIWKATLINDTYQSIKGRGLHKAVKKIQKFVYANKNELYYIKLDVKKFYPSIDNIKLKETIRKKIKCVDTLAVLDEIIDSTSGVPIGNYLSQYFGNLFISDIDHDIKENMQIKQYYRYCDDIVAIHESKNKLHKCLARIVEMLAHKKLSVKSNYCLNQINEGLDFLGIIVYCSYSKLRRRIKVSYITKSNTGMSANTKASYNGWLRMCNSYRLLCKYNKIKETL